MTGKKYKDLKVSLPESTKELAVPNAIIDQVIGQEKAVEIVKTLEPGLA